jgi:hypothetical protein
VEPQFTNLIRSWRPFVTRNVRKLKLCVLSESYTATDDLPPILPACRQPLLPACVFVTRDTVRHPIRFFFFRKFVRELICSWWEAFVNRGTTVNRFVFDYIFYIFLTLYCKYNGHASHKRKIRYWVTVIWNKHAFLG